MRLFRRLNPVVILTWHFCGNCSERAAADRQERAIARRIREARFPIRAHWKILTGHSTPPLIDRTQIEQLATGDWVNRFENLVLLGQSGVGKSRLLEGIGRRLCVIGKRVRYTTSGDLIAQLTASLADGTLPRQISYWTKFDLLIVDEFGLDYVERRLDPQAGHLLFKVIAARNGKSSTALGTNIEFEAWGALPRRRSAGHGTAGQSGGPGSPAEHPGKIVPRLPCQTLKDSRAPEPNA